MALAPALRQRPALEWLDLAENPVGDEGLAALVAPPPPAGAPPPPTGGLAKLQTLALGLTQIADAGCATLVAALESDALPALDIDCLGLYGIQASDEAIDAVSVALDSLRLVEVVEVEVVAESESEEGEDESEHEVQIVAETDEDD